METTPDTIQGTKRLEAVHEEISVHLPSLATSSGGFPIPDCSGPCMEPLKLGSFGRNIDFLS